MIDSNTTTKHCLDDLTFINNMNCNTSKKIERKKSQMIIDDGIKNRNMKKQSYLNAYAQNVRKSYSKMNNESNKSDNLPCLQK